MKNRKGFTMVEIIVSITLFAFIGLSVGISLTNINKKREYNSETEVVNKIKSAADVYLSTNKVEMNKLYTTKAYLTINISELQTAGLLSTNIIDPTTGDYLS